MSGAAGGSRISKENLKATIRDYRENVLKPLDLDKSYSITGVRSRPEKDIYGDIDIVVSFPGGDKKELKQDLAKFISQIDKIPSLPHKKNNKYFIHGNIVSILYPIIGKEGEYVQIDNIVAASKEEGKFAYNMLDLPAQEQTLAIGLAKTIFTELDEKQIEKLFKELNVPTNERPGEGEEYDFNLNPSELTLRIVPIGEKDGREIWRSNKFEDVKKLTAALGVDIEKDKFDTIVSKVKKFKNRRSIDRLKGMFAKNIRVGDAEKEIEKGIKKQQAMDTVAALENKYSSLVMSLIHPFIEGETIILEEQQPKIIAVFPGKFKPPHKDHIARIKAAAGDADEVIVLISPKTEPGGEPKTKKEREKLTTRLEDEMPITSDQSLAIFKAANLPSNVKVIKSNDPSLPVPSPSPVAAAYELFRNNPDQQYIGVFGKEEDFGRFGTVPQNTTIKNYDNSAGNLSATDLRRALKNDEDITPFLPDGVSSERYKQILGLDIVQEEEEITIWINEIVPEPDIDDIDDYADYILDPIDIEIPDHFIDRVNDKRNRPEIETDELYDFFEKLSDEKDELADLLTKGEVVATDLNTDINIPLVKDTKKSQLRDKVVAVAKTIMRKPNFQTTSTKLTFEQIQGDSIVCDDCGWKWKIKDGGDDLYICHKCGHDNTPKEEANNFFEPLQNKQIELNTSSESTRVDYYKDYYKNLSPPDFKVDKDKDKIVISNINKNSLENNSDFIEKLVSLTDYMMNHINIEPLPDVNFVEDDIKNADDFFGKTAYYNPNDKSITLYTLKRHPKDVLRSFAHEMVHHKQNLEGKLNDIQGQNINEDDYLKELEAEAYKDGNGLLFRGWENSIK
jgi:hypothetical protein